MLATVLAARLATIELLNLNQLIKKRKLHSSPSEDVKDLDNVHLGPSTNLKASRVQKQIDVDHEREKACAKRSANMSRLPALEALAHCTWVHCNKSYTLNKLVGVDSKWKFVLQIMVHQGSQLAVTLLLVD